MRTVPEPHGSCLEGSGATRTILARLRSQTDHVGTALDPDGPFETALEPHGPALTFAYGAKLANGRKRGRAVASAKGTGRVAHYV